MLVHLGWTRNVETARHYLALEGVVREQAARLSRQDLLGIVPGGEPEPYPEVVMALIERLRGALPDLTLCPRSNALLSPSRLGSRIAVA